MLSVEQVREMSIEVDRQLAMVRGLRTFCEKYGGGDSG